MKAVVDTDIAFSCFVRSDTLAAEILLHTPGQLLFFSPLLLTKELQRHRAKLKRASKLGDEALDTATKSLLARIVLMDDAAVSFANRDKALSIVTGVDEADAPFIALALELDALLWTGDHRLVRGLRRKGFHHVISTVELAHMR